MGKAGRKQNKSITDNEMLLALEQYTKEYPNDRINIKRLAEFSRIERHYWYSREGFKERIEDINSISYEEYDIITEEDKKQVKLPSIEELIDNNFRNKKRLKAVLSSFFNTYQELYDSSCEAYKFKKEINILKNKVIKYEEENEKLRSENKKHKELSDYYERRYYEIAVRSKDSYFRRENNIKSNVIEINNKNIKVYSTAENDLDSLLNSIDD